MDQKTLRRYALVGVRVRLLELADELAGLRDMLPSHTTLETASAALRAASEEVDEVRATPPAPPVSNGHAPRRRSRLTRREVGGAKSWATGRALLAVLAHEPDGQMRIIPLARKLKLTRSAAVWRAKVRIKHGHLRRIGDGFELFELTDEGRAALIDDLSEGD